MHIAGRHDHLVKLFSEFYDLAVDLLQIFDGLHIGLIASQHKGIVSDRLDLQIIIEIDQSCNFLIGSVIQHSLIQFARLTGRTKQQSLSVTHKFALRDQRSSVIVFQMRAGHQTIQIDATQVIGRQQDCMV